jgi:valyl-tRNA synthetase
MLAADYGIVPGQAGNLAYIVKPGSDEDAERLLADIGSVESLLRAGVRVEPGLEPDTPMASGLCGLGTLYLPLEGLVDVEVELRRITTQLDEASAHLRQVSAKLENDSFVNKAPAHVVDRQRSRRIELVEQTAKLQHLAGTLKELQGAGGTGGASAG